MNSIGIILWYVICVRSHVMAVKEPSLDQDRPLNGECSEQEIETKWWPWVALETEFYYLWLDDQWEKRVESYLEKSHQESKSNNDHNVNILKPGKWSGQFSILKISFWISSFNWSNFQPIRKSYYLSSDELCFGNRILFALNVLVEVIIIFNK